MTGRITRDSRREDVRTRRKTLRQSALDAKRGGTSRESPDEGAAGRVTRNAVRTQTAKITAARRVEEKKRQKAITDREVQKAKPPFNPYVRVKHTGLSPFKSYQDASKRSKIAPWRAQAAKPAPSASAAGNRPANTNRAPAHGIAAISRPTVQPAAPEMKVAAGVIQFPILPHMHHAQITFRAPAKVQPIPFCTRPTKSALPTKTEAFKENVKPAPKLRPVRGVSVKAQSMHVPKVNPPIKLQSAAPANSQTKPQKVAAANSQTKPQKVAAANSQTKPQKAAPAKVKEIAQVDKPARKTTALPALKGSQSALSGRPTRAKSVLPPKPAKAFVAEMAKVVQGKRIEPPAKKARIPLVENVNEETNQEEEVLVPVNRITPPARVLRSSSRLQHRDKENLIPESVPVLGLPLVQRRRTKKPTIVAPEDDLLTTELEPAPIEPASQPAAASEPAHSTKVPSSPASSGATDERVKGLKERSSKLTKESERLRRLADEWVAMKSSVDNLTQNAIDEIDAVTGQTYLLINKKFIQYKGLIEGAYKNSKTTLDDLDGFWEMVYIQVEQLENQYRKLEDMKKRNWTSHSPAPVRRPTKTSAKPQKRPLPKTNFRKFLAEKKKEMTSSSESSVEEPQAGPQPQLLSPGLNMSVEEVVTSSVRSAHSSLGSSNTPARRTPRLARSPAPATLRSPPVPAAMSVPRQLRTPRRTMRITESPARKSSHAVGSQARTSTRVADSPLRGSLRTADSPFRGSIRGADSPFMDSPRAVENARRASRSIRLSTAMMRASQAIASELDSTITDPLAT